jgi:hypothetical protein
MGRSLSSAVRRWPLGLLPGLVRLGYLRNRSDSGKYVKISIQDFGEILRNKDRRGESR